MNRRKFLSFLGLGLAAVKAAPLLELLPPVPEMPFPLTPSQQALWDEITKTELEYYASKIADEVFRPSPFLAYMRSRSTVNHFLANVSEIVSWDYTFPGEFMVVPGRQILPAFKDPAYSDIPTELCPYPGKVLNPLRPYTPRVEDALIDPYHFVATGEEKFDGHRQDFYLLESPDRSSIPIHQTHPVYRYWERKRARRPDAAVPKFGAG